MSSRPVRTDTKIIIPSSQGIAYRIGNLNDKRGAVLDDFAPSILELDMDTFIASLLPPLPPPLPGIEQIMLELINSGDLVMIDQGDERLFWRAFATEPASSDCSENNTFAALAEIYDALMKHVPASLQATSRLVLNPNCAPYSQRTHQTRPDGYMVLNKSSVENGKCDSHYWEDLAVTMEFKKSNSDNNRSDNVKKQAFSIQQVMTYDPCRRFTFGLTIENTDTRLWFCSRSAMIVSEKMDFNQNPLILIFIFLAFTFASKSDLGWDDTMTSILVGKNIQYEIKVGDRTYKTIDILSNFAAHTIVGRATRVLLVRDVESQEEFVLKDVWLTKGRQPEHEVRSNLLDDIQAKLGEPEMKEVERHLFTPVNYCIVQTQVNGKAVDDDTDEAIMRKVDLSGVSQFSVIDSIQEKHMVEAVEQTPHTSEHVNTRATRPNSRGITHRYHYRIVYKEYATPLYEVNRLSLVITTLEDLVKVLCIFHRAGWIHRDISAGNVFLFQKHELFKLGDLEFAKKMGKDGDVRTGTLDFMSVEVERQRYMFIPVDSNVRFFYHNSLHELESVWWLATWILFFHYPVGTAATESLNAQKAAVNELFPRILPNDRLVFTRVPGEFERIIESLHVDFHPHGNKLDNLRASLQTAYINFEARLVGHGAFEQIENFSENSLDGIHETFRLTFREMKEELNRSCKDIKLTRLHKVTEDVKRKLEPGSDDVQGKRSRFVISVTEVKRIKQSRV